MKLKRLYQRKLQLYMLLRVLKIAQLPLQALSQKTQMSLDFWTDDLRHDYFCITSYTWVNTIESTRTTDFGCVCCDIDVTDMVQFYMRPEFSRGQTLSEMTWNDKRQLAIVATAVFRAFIRDIIYVHRSCSCPKRCFHTGFKFHSLQHV